MFHSPGIKKKQKQKKKKKTGSVLAYHSQEQYLSLFFPLRFSKFECNTTSDWLNRTVLPIRSCFTFKCC